jgi:polyisoprenoid-binding protein YceI
MTTTRLYGSPVGEWSNVLGQAIAGLMLTAAACMMTGCSDPADKVQKAATSDAKKTDATAVKAAKEYSIRAASKIEFVGSKVTRSHNGGFTNFAGKIRVANGKISGSPEVKISTKSLWADDRRLTGHLKSKDFFDVATYPVATFTVTGVEAEGAQQKVTGNLDLHGVAKSISFPADIKVTDGRVAVKAEFAINRRDFNINYPGMPNDLIRDNVVIKLDLQATPGPPQPEDQLVN